MAINFKVFFEKSLESVFNDFFIGNNSDRSNLVNIFNQFYAFIDLPHIFSQSYNIKQYDFLSKAKYLGK